MTYRYEPSSPIKNVEDCRWFDNSYETIENWDHRDVDDVDYDYEKKFNLKLIYGDPENKDSIRPIIAIDFPSQEDAILFMLRWG